MLKLILALLLFAAPCAPSAGNIIYKDVLYKAAYQEDEVFADFWQEFRSALISNDKSKVADMTLFPIGGDADWYFSGDNGKSYPNNRESFMNIAYDRMFGDYDFSRIKDITGGVMAGNVKYEFIKLKNYFYKDFLVEDGYELHIYDNTSPDNEFDDYFVFLRADGVYKFAAKMTAG